MKRNLLFLLMTLVLPIGACAYDAYINGIYYNFSGNEAEVTSSNTPGSYSGILVIPEFVGKDEKTYRVTSIGEEAFFDCRTLTSITIPNYLTHIGSGAFYWCKSLTEVHIKDMEAWCKITFGEPHSNPLYYAKHLYMNGQEIKDLTIPDSIATINNYAFYNCSDLKTITLPGSITSIGHDAFYGCSSLTDVYCDANEVPEAVSSAFPYASLRSATLHVPAGSIDKYKAQSPWSRFGNIVAMQEEPHQPQSFLEGNPIWVYKYERLTRGNGLKDGEYYGVHIDTGNRKYSYYFLGGQEEIEGKVYTMMGEVKSDGEGELAVSRWLPVREENGIVYAFTDSLPGLVEHDYLEPPYLQQGNECVLYNFNTEIGESLYPQNEYTKVESYGTYQLMNGAVCRVLKTTIEDFDLYEKLGYLHDGLYYGVMDPPSELISSTGGDVYATHLNAYYQNDIMLYKAPDIQESICVNDTCWSRDDGNAYVRSYKVDPRQEEVFAYIRQLQKANEPVAYFPEGTKWTEIRLDTLKYNSWYSKVGEDWVPNFETIEYYVQGEYIDDVFEYKYKKVYTNGPEWTDSLTLLISNGESHGNSNCIFVKIPEGDIICPTEIYQFDWSVGKRLWFQNMLEANTTCFPPCGLFNYGIIDEIKEGDFGGVRPLKYVDLSGKAPTDPERPWLDYADTNGGRIIQGIGITEWNDGECLFGPPDPYYAGYGWRGDYKSRHYRSMLVHFERNNEVLYDVWPKKEIPSTITVKDAQSANQGIIFDLQGRRVSNPQKGIYIEDGRKVLIK